MIVQRYLNNVPITCEELYTKRITNDTLNRIFTNVKRRMDAQKKMRNHRNIMTS